MINSSGETADLFKETMKPATARGTAVAPGLPKRDSAGIGSAPKQDIH